MKPVYDYLFVTHLPAFYKVNLYNAIAKSCRVFVIFIAPSSDIRVKDFTQGCYGFDYCILNQDSFEKRKRLSSVYRLFIQIKSLRYRKIVVGGWDLIEFWFLVFTTFKKKNALALESSAYESVTKGFKGLIKKIFLKRISTVFSSGEPHRELLEKLKYKGEIKKTLGVGIFNYLPKNIKRNKRFEGNFLFVGRLAPEKNLEILLQAFSKLPEFSLTIIGEGELQASLQKNAPSNVSFEGYIPNQELPMWYQGHDVFILPSIKEPWGLVVEEALYYGLPVIVSNQVGCARDIVEGLEVGVLFEPLSPHSLQTAILWMSQHYDELICKIETISFPRRDAMQIQQYLEELA